MSKFKVGALYALPKNKRGVFIGYKPRHCQLHGEFMGYDAYFIHMREMPPGVPFGKKGPFKSAQCIYSEEVEAVLVDPDPEHKPMHLQSQIVMRNLLPATPKAQP